LVEAIKVVRQERNIGLKEAKAAVDVYVRMHPELCQRYLTLTGCWMRFKMKHQKRT
jgi:hypothetical protein